MVVGGIVCPIGVCIANQAAASHHVQDAMGYLMICFRLSMCSWLNMAAKGESAHTEVEMLSGVPITGASGRCKGGVLV